jgi:glycosyltransferase involved in cell wall biosynthesis
MKKKNYYFSPLVSVIIPVFNGEKYIVEAIRSVLHQTYKNIEIIVINDGSTDRTEKLIEPYLSKIRYFYKPNGGVSSALNLGIKKMVGQYFSWLSHDDLYLPIKIERQINYLNIIKDKNAVLYSDYHALYDFGLIKVKRRIHLNHFLLKKKPAYSLLRANINGITLLISKCLIEANGFFDESLTCLQDYDYWSRLIFKYDFIHLPFADSITRIHKGQTTRISQKKCMDEAYLFWIKLINITPDFIKISYEGSTLNFNRKYINYLKKTKYKESSEYLKKVIHKENI